MVGEAFGEAGRRQNAAACDLIVSCEEDNSGKIHSISAVAPDLSVGLSQLRLALHRQYYCSGDHQAGVRRRSYSKCMQRQEKDVCRGREQSELCSEFWGV